MDYIARSVYFTFLILLPFFSLASAPRVSSVTKPEISTQDQLLEALSKKSQNKGTSLIFDIPLTYNSSVNQWIKYYQTEGRKWFTLWLERSTKYLPYIKSELKRMKLPLDLAYIPMVESGFNVHASSVAEAVGPWQFIEATAQRYGLKVNDWLDERRDIRKSTHAAIKYMNDLYSEFGTWYLVAASYNMGESGMRKRIAKYKTKDFWKLSQLGALPEETAQYVPKILAAMVISKAPKLYGFMDYQQQTPLEYDLVMAPGGLDLNALADYMNVTRKALLDLNAEIVKGQIPSRVRKHPIRLPPGSIRYFAKYIIEKH